MGNPNKAKGDETERVAKRTLREIGFPWTEKTRAGYARDAGDLHLVPGPAVIAQAKFWKTYDWKGWLSGLALQKEEADADHAFLIVRRPGMPAKDARSWLAVTTLEDHAALMRQAGYGEPLDEPASAEASRSQSVVDADAPALAAFVEGLDVPLADWQREKLAQDLQELPSPALRSGDPRDAEIVREAASEAGA